MELILPLRISKPIEEDQMEIICLKFIYTKKKRATRRIDCYTR